MVAIKLQRGRAGKAPTLEVSSECVLRGAPGSLRAVIREQLTVNNPKYMDAKRYSRWVGKQLKPKLYFYSEHGSTLI